MAPPPVMPIRQKHYKPHPRCGASLAMAKSGLGKHTGWSGETTKSREFVHTSRAQPLTFFTPPFLSDISILKNHCNAKKSIMVDAEIQHAILLS